MVGTAVGIDIDGLVACHLSGGQVMTSIVVCLGIAHHEESAFDSLVPRRGPPFLNILGRDGFDGSHVLFGHPERITSRIDASRTQEGEGTSWLVAHGHTIASLCITLPLQLQMEPHHEFPCRGTIDYLGPFEHTAALDIMPGFIDHRKGHALVLPVG